MEVKQAIFARRSVRSFNQEPIDDECVREMLECAMAAPSACNKRPWEFYVVWDAEKQEALRHVSRYSNMNSTLMIVVAADDKRSLAHRVNDFWIQDCSAAVENILLAATARGIASCWCGLFPMATPVKHVRAILDLNENIIPMALLQLGYSDEKPEPRTQYDEKRVHYI